LIALGLALCAAFSAAVAVADPQPGVTGRRSSPDLQLRFTIVTGNDDLRGGNDNVSVTVLMRGQSTPLTRVLNRGSRWPDRSTNTVLVPLPRGVLVEEIQSITLTTSFGGGVGGDNWNMTSAVVEIMELGDTNGFVLARGGPQRFTGEARVLRLPIRLELPSRTVPGRVANK